jgi:hypothetical protein
MIGVFSLRDGSVQEQTSDELTPKERNGQPKRARAPANVPTAARSLPSAGSHPLQVQISPPVPTTKRARVAAPAPNHGMHYGPLSPSSDDTPVSATDPHQYQFQNLYPMVPDNAFGQHFGNSGAQSMGFLGSVPHNDVATFDAEYQVPLTGAGPYHGGLMPSGHPSQVSYAFDGSIHHENVFYPPEHGSSEYCSDLLVNYPHTQLTHPNNFIVSSTNYAGGNNFPHGTGQYYYPPNFGQ